MRRKRPAKRTNGGAAMEAVLPSKVRHWPKAGNKRALRSPMSPDNDPNGHTDARYVCVCTCKEEPYEDLHCELKQSRHLSNWRQSQSCSGGGGFDTVRRTATTENQGG